MFLKKTCGLLSDRPPFIKIALRFARAVGDACPYGFNCCSKFIIGRGGACSSRILQSLRHFLAKMTPPFTPGRRFLVLVLLFGVAFIDCRGRHPWRPVWSVQCHQKPSPVGEGTEERGG